MSEFWLNARTSGGWLLRRPAGAALAVFVAYLAAACAGWVLSSNGAFATFWPPNGVFVAALLLAPRRLWPYIVLATLPANLLFNELTHQRTLVSVSYWMVNVFEGLAISFALQSLGTDLRFERRRARSVVELALVAIAGTAASGFLGALATLIELSSASLLGFWASWTMADLLAILVLVPLLVTTFDAVRRARPISREGVVFGGALSLVAVAVVGTLLVDESKDYVLEPLMIPLLGWAALRLGVGGTAWAIAVTTVLTIANSVYGTGKFLLPEGFTPERAVAFQAVLSALSATFLGIAAAVADARQSEDELKRSAVARRDYVATMTHEIKNPLGVILGALQVIDADDQPDLTRRFESARAIERAARQILDVAEELLGGGLDALHQPVVADTFWLPALWRDLGDSFAHVARPSGVELRWVSPAPDVSLTTDRWRVQVVVRNLVLNALEFTERGTVSAECVVADDALALVVRDTGIGIPADEQRRIFQPYGRAGDPAMRDGSGIGLVTVTRFARDLGGTVALTSELGRGSEFRVTVPLVLPLSRTARDIA
jgi:signal transduction histidine kinase